MHFQREHDRIRLKADPLEAKLLEQLLRLVIKQYELKPSELDPKIANAWYSTRGCQSSGMNEEESADWIESLHSMKLGHVARLKEWADKLAARRYGTPSTTDEDEHERDLGPPVVLELTFPEATTLIGILNDYRLLLAARHDIGQREMDLHSLRALHELPPAQRTAVYQIEVVALLMEQLLRLVAPDASRWMV